MSEKKVRRFDYDQEFQGFVDSASGALVLYIDYAARVGDLEHRLANCDADLFKMQQAKDRAERRLAAAQARIDELMLEYCPDEITAEQLETWMGAQVPVSEQPLPPEKPA